MYNDLVRLTSSDGRQPKVCVHEAPGGWAEGRIQFGLKAAPSPETLSLGPFILRWLGGQPLKLEEGDRHPHGLPVSRSMVPLVGEPVLQAGRGESDSHIDYQVRASVF